MFVTAFFLLSSLGIVITAQAQECSNPIGGPNMILKDDDILLQTFPDGTKVTWACVIGYRSAGGSAVITCSAGSWSPVQLKCERKNCGPIGDVDNGQVNYPTGTEFGDKAVITCDTGYRMVGKREITCGDKGWLYKLPECEVVICDPPPNVVNGNFKPMKDNYEYREIVQYSCNKDLTLNGSISVFCSDDGTFASPPASCIKVECEEPLVSHSEWIQGSRPPHGYMASLTLQCLPGFIMQGSPTLTCQMNSSWSPQLPKCQRSVAPTIPPTTIIITTTPPSSTVKPTGTGNDLPRTLGIVFGVFIALAVLIICGCYCFGVPAFIRKKRGTRRGNTDKEATKDGEDVALS